MHDVTTQWRRQAGAQRTGGVSAIALPLARLVGASGIRVLGIAGAPGSGKSTVAHAVADDLRSHGQDPLVISLDDYYLSKRERAKRGIERRGPPGTHDVPALLEALDGLASGRGQVTVQRFSPALDDQIDPVTIDSPPTHVLLEGWVLGSHEAGYEEILDRLDLLVFLDVDDDTAKRRRYEREAALREHGGGFSEDAMNRFWDEVLAPGLPLWVADARAGADLIIEIRPDGSVRRVTTSSPLVVAAIADP